MWAFPVGLPAGSEYDSVPISAVDPTYGLEPVGAPGCDCCDAWRADREVARETRKRKKVQRANAEITRHPDHLTWPGEEAFQ